MSDIKLNEYEFSICILTLNQLERTKKCLLSLIKTEFISKTELIIVDNGSTDSTDKWLYDFQNKYNTNEFRIVLVLNKENRGCTGGRNQACKLAVGKYIVILDNDVEIIQNDWLIKLKDFYKSQGSNIGIVGPKMLYPGTDIIQQIGLGVTQNGKIGYWGQGKNKNVKEFNNVKELQGYPAACWLLKRELFEKFGYFDDIYYPVNLEDVDFCYRIREQGYKIMYCPYVEMYHYEHATTQNTQGLSFIRVTIKNGLIFKERWRHMFENEVGMTLADIYWLKNTGKEIDG